MLNHPAHLRLVKRLLERDGSPPPDVSAGEVTADRYLCHERFLRERATIFARTPVLVAASEELSQPGSCLAVELAGVSVLLTRGQDGVVRGFKNACRHRSTELLSGEAPCVMKAIVCRYHGWTYDLAGRLTHVPHRHAFDGKPNERNGLISVHVAERHGLVWASLEPFDPDGHLGDIADELRSVDIGALSLHRRSSREVQGNWKLVIDAFLDGYHIRHLHKDTLHRFFLDARFEAERAGPHLRAVTARRALLDVSPASVEDADLRAVVTPSYWIFPHTILVLHPDYLSVLTASPARADRTRFVHWMFVPPPRTDAERAHWTKSFELIDEGVFGREDLAAVEAMQRGLATRANESILFGKLEYPALWFHEAVDARVGQEGASGAPR